MYGVKQVIKGSKFGISNINVVIDQIKISSAIAGVFGQEKRSE